MILSFQTDMSGQTVQTQIRLLLYQGLHCLLFRLHGLDSLHYGRATKFKFESDYNNFWGVRIFRKFMVFIQKFEQYSKQSTVTFLNIRTPKKFVVITLKFELCGRLWLYHI